MDEQYALGDRVAFPRGARLKRHTERRKRRLPSGVEFQNQWEDWRVWRREDDRPDTPGWLRDHFEEELEGIVVGQRTATNGTASWSYGDPTAYTSMEGFQVLVIATSLRGSHVKVRVEDVRRG